MWNLTQKKNRSRKNGDKDKNGLYKLINNPVYGKTMKNVRNIIDLKLVSNKKNYLKWTSTTSYMSQKVSDKDLVSDNDICWAMHIRFE